MRSKAGLSEIQNTILDRIKVRGSATISELAEGLAVSYEAVRLQVSQMHREGWLDKEVVRTAGAAAGRPLSQYSLTPAGEHLFPKFYDQLSIEVIDTVADRFGSEGLRDLLADLAEKRVQEWAPRLQGLDLEEKLAALELIYLPEDPHMEVEAEGDELRLIERSCPFLNVALERPALCSLTVSTLSKLLGRQVVREKTFQRGDGRCVFRVLATPHPADAEFRFESEG